MAWVLTVSNWICQLEIYHFYRESCFSVSDEMSGSIFNVWLLTVFSTHFSPFSTQLISRKSISEQSDRKPHCSIFDTFLLLLSHVWFVATPWIAAQQASPSSTISWNLLKLISIEPVMPSNHLILCCPLFLPSVFPSISVFSNESAFHIKWPGFCKPHQSQTHAGNLTLATRGT